jgi:alkylhydroperoxidase family enzyme
MPRFEQIRDSPGNPRLKALYKEIVGAGFGDVNPGKLPPVQRVVVEFAAKTAANPKSISDEDLKSLRGHGLSNGEVIDVAMIAAFANFLNAWAEVSGIFTDREEASA